MPGDIVARRWMRAKVFAARTEISERTVRDRCLNGRYPASKRGTSEWWIDLYKLRETVSGGADLYHDVMTSESVESEE